MTEIVERKKNEAKKASERQCYDVFRKHTETGEKISYSLNILILEYCIYTKINGHTTCFQWRRGGKKAIQMQILLRVWERKRHIARERERRCVCVRVLQHSDAIRIDIGNVRIGKVLKF